MNGFQKKYQKYLSDFQDFLQQYCAEMNFAPSVLTESMRYSLLNGGKRVRPVLFFAALDLFHLDYSKESCLAICLLYTSDAADE